jgi:uncharacterized membrane protein
MKLSLQDLTFTRVALFVSLAVNIALAGYLASQWMMPRWRPLANVTPAQMLQLVTRILPAPEAGILRDAYRVREPQINAQRAAFEQARARALEILAQPDLDVPALRAAIEDARQIRAKQGEVLIDLFVDTATRLPPQTRQNMAARFQRR